MSSSPERRVRKRVAEAEDNADRYRIIAQRLAMTSGRPSGRAWLTAYKLDVKFLLAELQLANQQASREASETLR